MNFLLRLIARMCSNASFALILGLAFTSGFVCPLMAAENNVPTDKAQVLLLTGCDYPGHHWKLTGPVLARQLEKDPRLEVRIVEDPQYLTTDLIHQYDAIVLHYMNWEQPDPGPQARANLKQFVAGGKGLVLVHFACGAFQEWPDFVHLAGRVYNPQLRGHDPRGPFQVIITDRDHPVTAGLEDFQTDDELYTCLDGTVTIRTLAVARSKVDQKNYPMAFVLDHGKGRIFHSPLGHDVRALSFDEVGELYRRGCAWAAGLSPVSK